MGLIAEIYKSRVIGDCSNHGISEHANSVCIVNIPGPFDPHKDCPAVVLVKRKFGNVVCVPEALHESGAWTMDGGCIVDTSDSRFHEAVAKLSGYKHGFPVALHDRVEA